VKLFTFAIKYWYLAKRKRRIIKRLKAINKTIDNAKFAKRIGRRNYEKEVMKWEIAFQEKKVLYDSLVEVRCELNKAKELE